MKRFKTKNMKLLAYLKISFSSLLMLLLTSSCQDKKPQAAKEFDKKMEETVQIHDDVMPKMSEINGLINKLEQKQDSLAADQKIEEAKEKLQKGHDKMMNWMKDLSDTFTAQQINQGIQIKDKDSLKKALEKLEKLKSDAKDMKESVNSALKNAKQILSSTDQ